MQVKFNTFNGVLLFLSIITLFITNHISHLTYNMIKNNQNLEELVGKYKREIILINSILADKQNFDKIKYDLNSLKEYEYFKSEKVLRIK